MRRLVPAALAVAFALWSWLPARDSMAGQGVDPLFNLWHFEVLWGNLSSRAPLLWAPLYGGSRLGLAYSENQLAPAALLWPLRAALGNGALTLGAAAVVFSLLAFLCGAAWLRVLGLRELAPWGGLLLAGCGWLQSQQAHYQNLCIFVLPLAFWSWERYARDPRPLSLLLCALGFGWIGAWNLYFQVFADACLLVWALRARRPAVLALSLALQLPLAWPYLQLGASGALTIYGAGLRSLLGSSHRPRLFLPSFEVDVESAGYLGVAWLALLCLSWRRRESRPWLLGCALAFWASLGRGFGLFDVLALLPGISGLRAIGRAQALVLLFSLPAVLGFLQSLPQRRVLAALAIVCLDWLPASRPERMAIPPQRYAGPAALRDALAASDDALLVWPPPDARVMLSLSQLRTPYFGGYSGYAPPGEELLGVTADVDEALDLTRARRVLATAPLASPRLRGVGCFELPQACLYEAARPALAALRLDRDAQMIPLPGSPWPAAELRAMRDGALEIRALDGCRMRQTASFGPLSWSHELPVEGLRGVRFRRGEVILRVEAKQWLFRRGGARAQFAVVCATREPR